MSVFFDMGNRMAGSFDSTIAVAVGPTSCRVAIWTADTAISCRSPRGVGSAIVVETMIGSQKGQSLQVAGYEGPVISRVTPQALPPLGNAPVTVEGRSFGFFDASGVVTVGLSACSSTLYVSDTSMKCIAPSGLGGNLNISVQIRSQSSIAMRVFSYFPPVLSDAFPRLMNTTGGTITVFGQNFGYFSQNQRIFVGNTACPSSSSSPWVSGNVFLAYRVSYFHTLLILRFQIHQ